MTQARATQKQSNRSPNPLKQYWRVLKLFWSTALEAELEYRVNFLIAALTSFGSLAGSLFSLSLFYQTGYQFQGWSWEEALLVLGVFTILQGFSATLLAPNLNQIVDQVQKGTLDFVLLKPISSQFWLSLRRISPWGLPDLIFGLILIGYAGTRLNLPPIAYVASVIPILFGLLILYSLWFILGATSIWFVKIYNVTEVLRGLLEAGRYPMAAYPVAYRVFFTFVVPVAFLTTIPAEVLLSRAQVLWIAGAGILAIVLLLFARSFWRFALRFYTSASS
ncbi:ABC transporter permease [Leptolyngbya sp. FACHB-711]|jgi:ABC-2 type transport system permease protein|uniref:ABC transporter permease n=1 Tax=unclassified Leptolyngbya TaxID=2650499 RepID=UPI001683D874|nr:ABC transporter permease [Leptolyngbya sp. FACHB-711]MBD1850352.1 ABC-2 family transporter protein [Cyanobacteria bacterium FACHB-502]MBD2023663.1 ABC-2 family transporter protein [Leptolyngbya sp. FACHB-711]